MKDIIPFKLNDHGQYIMYGIPFDQYTKEDYEYEKSTWTPSDLPKTDSEDESLFNLCRTRRDMIFQLHKLLDTPEMKDVPSNPSFLGFIKYMWSKFKIFI